VRTTKPISTISYNSPEYLALKLDEFQSCGLISFWAFIRHEPEDDEGGLKQHFHVFVEPAKLLQTDSLKEGLQEFDPEHPDKPFGCISWRSSKFDDWYLYSLHDSRYLASKGQTRRFHYQYEEFAYSSEPDFRFHVKSIDMTHLSPIATILDAQKLGMTFAEFLASGAVPFQQIGNYRTAWFTLQPAEYTGDYSHLNTTNRGGRKGHENEEE